MLSRSWTPGNVKGRSHGWSLNDTESGSDGDRRREANNWTEYWDGADQVSDSVPNDVLLMNAGELGSVPLAYFTPQNWPVATRGDVGRSSKLQAHVVSSSCGDPAMATVYPCDLKLFNVTCLDVPLVRIVVP